MRLQGERSFALPLSELYSRLSDAAFLVGCIPDATLVGAASADSAQCTVRPGFSFARGSLDVAITVQSRQPDTAVTFLLASKGIGTSADVEAALALTPADDATKVSWTANVVKLGGLLKAVPSGLIRGAAQKVIDDVWAGIDERIRHRP